MHSGIELNSCLKNYHFDQHKARTPEQTLEWAKARIAGAKLPILTETRRIDTGRLGIPVFISLCGTEATRLTGTKKQMGKGATEAQSEASAVMELIERFSFFSLVRGGRFPIFASGDAEEETLSAQWLLRSVYDEHTPLSLCETFLEDFPMRWVPARNLTRGVDQWLPIDWFYLINEYNGPSAGNTLEEAVLQGLCEVVERHVGSVVSYERRSTPALDPASVKDPAARELLDKFERQGIRLYLRDFSLDTGIPSVGVLAYDPATYPDRSEIVFTVGTTPDPETSLSRALTEIAQLAGDFENRTSYRPTLPKYRELEEARHLLSDSEPAIGIGELPNLSDPDMRVEIESCVEALKSAGLEVLTVDLTHPDLQVPAVYVIVPGAHFLDRTRGTDFAQHAARTALEGLPPGEAIVQLERICDTFGPRYDLTFFLAACLEREGHVERALETFEEALEQRPDPGEVASVYTHIASCRKELGRFESALEALEVAEGFNDELKEIFNLRGFCLYKLKRHEEAIEAFERAIEIDPGSAIDYANIGSNLRELGHKREAVKLYRMALELEPEIEFARQSLARLEEELHLEAG
jgi:ribosomal protein S12 methylthiotransferase accessory factor